MSLNTTPESSTGVWSAIKQSLGLFGSTNKVDGVDLDNNPDPIDEYESTLSEEEITQLIMIWKRKYSVYYAPIKKGQELSFDYWVGKQRNPEINALGNTMQSSGSNVDNLIFEAVETFLPIATRANPEAVVNADPSDIGQLIAKDLQVALAYEADVQKLRRKLAKMTRGWLLNRLGVLKVSWNPITKKIETDVINAKRMVFDPDGFIDDGGNFVGEWLGERKNASAELLKQMFPGKHSIINAKSSKKNGTVLEYFEWWYRGRDVFYTLDEFVLGKFKNPNWNYDTQAKDGSEAVIDPETGDEISPAEIQVDAVEATNHLDIPSAPYRFLSIFSTGEQPHDNTSLVLQNIPGQDIINKREAQIDRNVEGMNNGMVVSGKSFTEEQASQAASALRRGVAIRVPDGDVQRAVVFPQKPALPADVFRSLQDRRAELRNIFGTAGSTPQGAADQDTIRGKIMVSQMDSSRIGGGITSAIEQVADSIYNLWVQFMFVYYDEEHFVNASGTTGGGQLIALKNDKFPLLKSLDITVKDDSMIPKDPLTERNEAIDLWSANAIDPLSFYKRLDFPDPEEATNSLILWQMLQKGQIQPQQYLPSFTAGAPQQQTPLPKQGTPTQPGTGGPAVSPPPNQGVENAQSGTPEQEVSKQLIQSQPL
jgi:hypothetical protein